MKEGDESPKCLQHQHFTDWSGVTLKRVDELKPGDRIRMKVGHATVVATESLDDDRTLLTTTYGTKGPADNALTVDVLDDDEWGWQGAGIRVIAGTLSATARHTTID